VDASGVAFVAARPPTRIVSLIPSTTELLCALGLADALVGITVYCREPREVVRTKTRIGGEKDPDLQRIRALTPDLVIANVEENQKSDIDALRAWGLPVWVTYPRTVAGALDMIRDLGQVTGAPAAAAALLAELTPLYERVRGQAETRPPARVFYAIWRDPWMTVGGDTYIADMLRCCGGVTVFAGHADRYPAVTLDEVAAARPDVILLPDEPFRFRPAHLKDFAPYTAVPAVRDHRMHLVDGKPFSWHGPRIAGALRTLPALLHR
jgi:ABC-type Fe3+-hydroxamate transport system substrate-binding protein